MAQMVKNLPAMWETWVGSLGWEDLLEKEMATYSSTLALKIPWTEVHDIVQETGINTILMEKKCKKAKWLSGQLVKNPLAMQETLVRFLGQEDPLEKG